MGNYAKSAALAIIGGIAIYFHMNSGVKETPVAVPGVDPVAERSLKKVAFLFRHGDRAPLNSFKNNTSEVNSEVDLKLWPDGNGELTKVGKRNAYLLGKRLRNRYDVILTPHYSKDNLRAISTKVERTLMSAYLVLAGMYPPANHQQWSDEISWTPIPVYHDTVFNRTNGFICPRFQYEVLKGRDLQDEDQYDPIYKFLQEKTDLEANPKKGSFIIFGLYDKLNLRKRHGYKNEEWADEFLELVRPFVNKRFTEMIVKTEVQRQLASSLLAEHYLRFIDDKIKVSLFSGHDITMYILSGALGFSYDKVPNPTACVAIEFHEENGHETVKAFYFTEATGTMEPLTMGCGLTCTLSDFKDMLLKTKPEDYNALCNTVPDHAEFTKDKHLPKILTSFQPL